MLVNSQPLYQLSYGGIPICLNRFFVSTFKDNVEYREISSHWHHHGFILLSSLMTLMFHGLQHGNHFVELGIQSFE